MLVTLLKVETYVCRYSSYILEWEVSKDWRFWGQL
jgi:hypothetical protein